MYSIFLIQCFSVWSPFWFLQDWKRNQEVEVKDEKQEEKKVQASDTSEGKYSSMDDNSKYNDDEFVLT